jgi:hypothetical protein
MFASHMKKLQLANANPSTTVQAFFQTTIPYVNILDHQGTIEQNESKTGVLNVSDQTSLMCVVVLCMDTIW